jgi:hypothetical protein
MKFKDFKNLPYLIKIGFFLEGDPHQEDEKFHCAHWYMCMETLRMLSESVIDLSRELVNYYKEYVHYNTANFQRRISYNRYIRTWMDFYGNIVNLKETIFQYHDLFIRAFNKIDPDNKEKTYYAYKSAGSAEGLQEAVKELIILGNMGRLEGFALLRSMIEICITRELFNLTDSQKHMGKKVVFSGRDIASINSICKSIDRIGLSEVFETDLILRVYSWGSKVSHRGYRCDEYITWFMRGVCGSICNLFSTEINNHRDKILEDLEKHGQIKIA